MTHDTAAEEHKDDHASSTGALGRSAAAGMLWLTAQKWLVRISGLATIAILTRLIEPQDFGAVAAASAITPFVLLLSDLGLTTYIVQTPRLSQRTLSTGFWFSISVAATLCGAMILSAPLLAGAFGIPAATPVIQTMSLSVAAIVLSSVPTALMRRRMQFRLLAVQASIGVVVSQVIAVVLALRGAGAWALVAQIVTSQAIACVLAWRSAGWRPTLEFSRLEFGFMARYGGNVVAVDMVATARAAAEAAVISNVLGAAALGYMSIAQRLIQVAQDMGGSAIVPVSTVVFAKIRESGDRLRSAYVRALRLSYAAVSPVMMVVAVGGSLLIPLIFGPNWGASIPVAQALAVAAILTLGAGIDNGLFYGAGRPGRWLAYAVVIDGLTLAVTIVAAPHGLTAVAAGFVGVAAIATAARWWLVSRLIDIGPGKLARVMGSAALSVVASGAVGLGVLRVTEDSLPPILALACVSLAVLVTHLVVVRLVSPAVYTDALGLLTSRTGLARRFKFLARL
ncbi:lipopolysaccharide biosynthesis protein [Cellulomonas sp. McL0617]|uniref:lipopolysaccharide biosynthesis protein n=1 Tax=Cellulomonas sp. McL0617 TaxID=3415675 RepID=UPI003CF5A1A1